jgi:hypothetical protein
MRSDTAGPAGTKSHRPQGVSQTPEGHYSPVRVTCGRRFTNVMENPASKGASMASAQGSTGVDQDRGMCEEKRKMNRFARVGTLNSGGPESEPEDAERHPKANCYQPQEDAVWTLRESDPPIVVRDGNTDHKAKDQAGMQSGQSTHARGRYWKTR